MHACFSGYARVSQTIWLNFTQETKKCFKHAREPRRGSLGTLFEVLLCSWFDRKVRQHILMTLLGNRSSPTMSYYGMGI
jgi:hypothetical protein